MRRFLGYARNDRSVAGWEGAAGGRVVLLQAVGPQERDGLVQAVLATTTFMERDIILRLQSMQVLRCSTISRCT